MTGPKITLSEVRDRWACGAVTSPAQAAADVEFLLGLIDRLHADQSAASFELVMMAQELNWATDGQLTTAVRHAKGVLARRTEERDRLRHEVNMLQCQVDSRVRRGEDVGF